MSSVLDNNLVHVASGRRRLEGKVALITGGAAGIGEATAKVFCQHGAKVVIADIQDDLGLAVCRGLGPDAAVFVHCDVSKEDDVRAAVDLAVARYGKLDIMFNNAAVIDSLQPSITGVDASVFERLLSVNVTGVFLGTKHAARVMVPAGNSGSIINTASVASLVGGVSTHAYVASKHAVVGLTKNAAAELGQHGIRVNCISPYVVASSLTTEFFNKGGKEMEDSAGRMGNLKGTVLRAEDIALAAVYFGSDESKYVSGHNLVVDGGFTTVNNSFGLFNH